MSCAQIGRAEPKGRGRSDGLATELTTSIAGTPPRTRGRERAEAVRRLSGKSPAFRSWSVIPRIGVQSHPVQDVLGIDP